MTEPPICKSDHHHGRGRRVQTCALGSTFVLRDAGANNTLQFEGPCADSLAILISETQAWRRGLFRRPFAEFTPLGGWEGSHARRVKQVKQHKCDPQHRDRKHALG